MIYTIGHSNHDMNVFIKMLKRYHINCICDVRSIPYSRFAGQYNKEVFSRVLRKNGIFYLSFGNEFGARRLEADLQTNGSVDFEKVAKDKMFLQGVQRIEKGIAGGYNIALLCTEKDPIKCHRAILVARRLHERGIEVGHILKNGNIQMHNQLEDELVHKYFPNADQMEISLSGDFHSQDLLTEAYRKANYEIGYKKANNSNQITLN